MHYGVLYLRGQPRTKADNLLQKTYIFMYIYTYVKNIYHLYASRCIGYICGQTRMMATLYGVALVSRID